MKKIIDLLKGNFVLLDMGSSDARDNKFLNRFAKALKCWTRN